MGSFKKIERRRQEQRSTMRSVLLNAGIAWPPSSTQMGIRFKKLIKAVKCASPAQRLLPVFHQSRPQPAAPNHPASGPARLTAARVSCETPSACQRTYAPNPGKKTGKIGRAHV